MVLSSIVFSIAPNGVDTDQYTVWLAQTVPVFFIRHSDSRQCAVRTNWRFFSRSPAMCSPDLRWRHQRQTCLSFFSFLFSPFKARSAILCFLLFWCFVCVLGPEWSGLVWFDVFGFYVGLRACLFVCLIVSVRFFSLFVCLWAQASKMKNALELLKGVGQDEELPDGLAETAEDLASADVMNHPVRTAPPRIDRVPVIDHDLDHSGKIDCCSA